MSVEREIDEHFNVKVNDGESETMLINWQRCSGLSDRIYEFIYNSQSLCVHQFLGNVKGS